MLPMTSHRICLNGLLLFSLLSLSQSVVCADVRITKLTLQNNQFFRPAPLMMDLKGIFLVDGEHRPFEINEISGLEWSHDEQLLYGISDSGYMFTMRAEFNETGLDALHYSGKQSLYINSTQSSKSAPDSEGIALALQNNDLPDDNRIYVSYENNTGIIEHNRLGQFLEQQTLAPALQLPAAYQGNNKQLESLTWHETLGLLTAPERPLNNQTGLVGLYSKMGKVTDIRLSDIEYGSITGLTTLPDGHVLALERVFINVFAGLKFTLHLLKFDGTDFKQIPLLTVDSVNSIFNDNFEAIAWHKENYFFIASDDNQNAMQRGLIVYFRLNHPELNYLMDKDQI